jgi:hypothetical protein
MIKERLKKIKENIYEIPQEGKMNVPDKHKVFKHLVL